MRRMTLLVMFVLVGIRNSAADGPPGPLNLLGLAQLAVAEDESFRTNAIETLRQAGPAGLDALFQSHAVTIARVLAKTVVQEPIEDSTWDRVRLALDTVGGQRDCHTSHLYWYTNLEAAKAAARSQKKPILLLQMLGKLSDEYSCANSRFFRSALYANREVSCVLREQFVLLWQSERPVPIVTIDFGDGRKLRRTVTGNSVHYILDADGKPLDALPGLYGPQAFLRGLERVAHLHEILERDRIGNWGGWKHELTQYHRLRLKELRDEWQADLEKLELWQSAKDELDFSNPPSITSRGAKAVSPQVAAQLAAARRDAAAQVATVAASVPTKKPIVLTPELPSQATLKDEYLWQSIAALHATDAALDKASQNMIARQTPAAVLAGRVAISKRAVETPLMRLVRNFQQTIAIDTVRNEYLLHREIHRWYAENPERFVSFEDLNQRVYSELFLTPKSDPWLGLSPPDTYSALDNSGQSQ